MVMSLHDIPGAHVESAHFAKLAEKTQQKQAAFRAPFKCKIRKVEIITGETWAGVNDSTDYNRLVLSKVTVALVETALGTINGSLSGNAIVANTPTSIYSPATYLAMEAGDLLDMTVGTVGAGSTAAPSFRTEVTYEGA